MKENNSLYLRVIKIALPITLQSLLQSSFSVIDQIMVGQLGSVSIAGIGLGGKFASLYTILINAIASAAGIMIAQYIGKKDEEEMSRSFFVNSFCAVALAVLFTIACIAFPKQIMGVYTKDIETLNVAATYLCIIAAMYLPTAITTLLSTLLRCVEAASIPLYATIFGAVVNTGLNYVLIFGRFGFPRLGIVGAALASVISQYVTCILIIVLFGYLYMKHTVHLKKAFWFHGQNWKVYLSILMPILLCEFFWSLGENVYAAIYGHIGTMACAAMTLTSPIQVLMIGALSGLAQAAAIIIGKSLGRGDYDNAYEESKKMMLFGWIGSAFLMAIIMLTRNYYVQIYQVEQNVQDVASLILIAFALILPIKIQNMVLGGGIIRSGGKTKYIMCVDFIGTWLFGVPLGLLAAFVLKLPIHYVYFMLSLEECVRLLITLIIFRQKKWMISLNSVSETGSSF